jgi:hypothetical protein
MALNHLKGPPLVAELNFIGADLHNFSSILVGIQGSDFEIVSSEGYMGHGFCQKLRFVYEKLIRSSFVFTTTRQICLTKKNLWLELQINSSLE